jgi:hypothetical protein
MPTFNKMLASIVSIDTSKFMKQDALDMQQHQINIGVLCIHPYKNSLELEDECRFFAIYTGKKTPRLSLGQRPNILPKTSVFVNP